MPSSYNRNYNRSSYGRRPSRRPNRRRNKKRIRNRIIIVSAAVIIFALLIFVIAMVVKGCSAKEPTVPASTETLASTQAVQQTTAPAGASGGQGNTDVSGFTAPEPEDNNEDGHLDGSLYVWNQSAFELFYGSDDSAASYAQTVNNIAGSLGGSVKVYSMIIPNHTEMGLPARLKDSAEFTTTSQAENIKAAYSKMNDSVTAVNCYNNLSEHCNDYIYFDSDHHWTGLGAYYAYAAFAQETEQDVLSLDDCQEHKIEGFTGSFTTMLGSGLKEDTVSYWTFPYETSMELTTSSGSSPEHYDSIYYEAEPGGPNTYGVFIYGDNPLTVLKSDRNTGRKIAVVKESYGNAFVPYLTYNYDEVHVIDFRHWEGSLTSYCQENSIDEVLLLNGIMSANTPLQIKAMESIV